MKNQMFFHFRHRVGRSVDHEVLRSWEEFVAIFAVDNVECFCRVVVFDPVVILVVDVLRWSFFVAYTIADPVGDIMLPV